MAKRESRYIDFKEVFDPAKTGDWCEVIKDLVAMANSGGGVILFGVQNNGELSDFDPVAVLGLDPAKITDKVASYTGEHFSGFDIAEVNRCNRRLGAIRVGEATFPLVFVAAGNYLDVASGKQKTAFQNGTVYFRHGAKSEPGNASDLRDLIERELERHRKAWLGGIRKVVNAPRGHTVEVVGPGIRLTDDPAARPVRLVDDSSAEPVHRLDPDVTHPYRQKELIREMNRRLSGKWSFTAYENQCIRRIHKIDEAKPEYYYCSKFGSPQYSNAYADWLERQFALDNQFFAKATQAARPSPP